jgi:hypothetical protein
MVLVHTLTVDKVVVGSIGIVRQEVGAAALVTVQMVVLLDPVTGDGTGVCKKRPRRHHLSASQGDVTLVESCRLRTLGVLSLGVSIHKVEDCALFDCSYLTDSAGLGHTSRMLTCMFTVWPDLA